MKFFYSFFLLHRPREEGLGLKVRNPIWEGGRRGGIAQKARRKPGELDGHGNPEQRPFKDATFVRSPYHPDEHVVSTPRTLTIDPVVTTVSSNSKMKNGRSWTSWGKSRSIITEVSHKSHFPGPLEEVSMVLLGC